MHSHWHHLFEEAPTPHNIRCVQIMCTITCTSQVDMIRLSVHSPFSISRFFSLFAYKIIHFYNLLNGKVKNRVLFIRLCVNRQFLSPSRSLTPASHSAAAFVSFFSLIYSHFIPFLISNYWLPQVDFKFSPCHIPTTTNVQVV